MDLRSLPIVPASFEGFAPPLISYFIRTAEFDYLLGKLEEGSSSSYHTQFILSGPSGTGKSISLLALFHYFLLTDVYLPLLVADSPHNSNIEHMQKSQKDLYGGKYVNIKTDMHIPHH